LSILNPNREEISEWSFEALNPNGTIASRAEALERILMALAQQTAANRLLAAEVEHLGNFRREVAGIVEAFDRDSAAAPVAAPERPKATLVPLTLVARRLGVPMCEQKIEGHDAIATVIAYWPGKTSKMCEPCVAKAQNAARAMGFELKVEVVGHTEIEDGGAA
jgi:hypothetical protein